MAKFVVAILAVTTALVAATALGALAHDGLGIHRDIIRINALASAALIGLALASNAIGKRMK